MKYKSSGMISVPLITQAISLYSYANLCLSASSCFLIFLAYVYTVLGTQEPCSSHEKPADDNGITETVLLEKKESLSSSLKLQHTKALSCCYVHSKDLGQLGYSSGKCNIYCICSYISSKRVLGLVVPADECKNNDVSCCRLTDGAKHTNQEV